MLELQLLWRPRRAARRAGGGGGRRLAVEHLDLGLGAGLCRRQLLVGVVQPRPSSKGPCAVRELQLRVGRHRAALRVGPRHAVLGRVGDDHDVLRWRRHARAARGRSK